MHQQLIRRKKLTQSSQDLCKLRDFHTESCANTHHSKGTTPPYNHAVGKIANPIDTETLLLTRIIRDCTFAARRIFAAPCAALATC